MRQESRSIGQAVVRKMSELSREASAATLDLLSISLKEVKYILLPSLCGDSEALESLRSSRTTAAILIARSTRFVLPRRYMFSMLLRRSPKRESKRQSRK